MEFGREAVAEHLVKNNMPRFKDWKLDLSGAIDGMMDFNAELDKFSKDIQKRKDNAMAMAFTKDIGDLLKKNGVCPKFEEYSDRVMGKTKIEMRYGVGLVDLDFSEHDKPFKDKIAKLEEEVHRLGEERREIRKRCASDGELHLFDLKRYGRLRIVAKDVMAENESLKQRISEIENFSCQAEQESESMILELKQRIAELEGKKTESLDEVPDSITIDGYKCKIINTERGLYISRDEIYSIIDKEKMPLRQKCKELEDRQQADCITINRLNTTIDVLIHKIEHLRQFAGLE